MTTDRMVSGKVFADERERLFPSLAAIVIPGCVLFNFFLCFLHTSGVSVSDAHVILFELTFVSLAVVYAATRPDNDRFFWLFILIAQFVFLLLLSLLRDTFLIKALRDVMMMPVFIAFGLAAAKTNFTRPLLWLSAFVLAVGIFEAASLDTFITLFNVKEYYIAKGYDPESFKYMSEDVFVSGIRPGGRFFPFPFEIHRVSSIFLEPVSLGFYAFISGLYFIAMKDRLPRKQVFLAIFLTMFLIWLGDARMAFGSLVVVILCRPIFARLDHRLTIFMFPAALLFGYFVVLESGMFGLDGEGLGARILWTFDGIWATGEDQFFGLKPYDIEMVDSGFLYLLAYQGMGGFLLYWLPPILFKSKLSKEARIYWFGASIFLTSGLLISNAIFTIKTAALLWFSYGYVVARTQSQAGGKLPRENV